MIALGNFLQAVAGVLDWVITIYIWVLIAYCILSFVSPDPRNPIVQIIHSMCEPILAKVRSKIPPIGMFDLSALVVLLGLSFLNMFLVASLYEYGAQFKQSGVATVGC